MRSTSSPRATRLKRVAVRAGLRSAERPAARPETAPGATGLARPGPARPGRRIGAVVGAAAVATSAWMAVRHIDWAVVAASLVRSSPVWVLLAIGLMSASMVLRAVSWRAILAAALPDAAPRLADAFVGTAIGV